MTGEPLLALVGPTATGKTRAAIALARLLGAEIVSADSMVVYRGMDIGTAKPDHVERAEVRHHLIDVAQPSEPFTVARYQELGRAALADIASRGARGLIAGGSGLYVRALVDELTFPGTDASTRAALEREAAAVGGHRLYDRLEAMDPAAASKIEATNVRRTVRALEVAAVTGRPFSEFAAAWGVFPPGRVRAAGIEMPREVTAARIAGRVRAMLDRGWLNEVRGLVDAGFGGWLTATQAIGYAELAAHLQGAMTLEDAVDRIVKRTRNLARRQMAWFRRDPRIRWFPVGEEGAVEAVDAIRVHLEATV